jgi:hypothetical protein
MIQVKNTTSPSYNFSIIFQVRFVDINMYLIPRNSQSSFQGALKMSQGKNPREKCPQVIMSPGKICILKEISSGKNVPGDNVLGIRYTPGGMSPEEKYHGDKMYPEKNTLRGKRPRGIVSMWMYCLGWDDAVFLPHNVPKSNWYYCLGGVTAVSALGYNQSRAQ